MSILRNFSKNIIRKLKKHKINLSENQIKLIYLNIFIYSLLIFAPLFNYLNKTLKLTELKLFVAKTTYHLLTFSGINAEQFGTFIKTNTINIQIIRDCTGWKSIFILFILILLTPKTNIKNKIIAILLSIPFSITLSIFRIYTSILLTIKFGIQNFTFIHDVLWQIILIFTILSYWYLWMYLSLDKTNTKTDKTKKIKK